MSNLNPKKFAQKKGNPQQQQGKSFLELLLQESPLPDDAEEMPQDLFDEPLGEIPIPDRKKRFKFLRFPKLKAMLDMLDQAEPEKADGYVIMSNNEVQPTNIQDLVKESEKRDDTEEFLNSISDKLKYLGQIGMRKKQALEKEGLALESDDDEAFEANVVKSITQDDEIVSETLAELLIAQGQKNKAAKMYKALILKFPEKSRYFAAKLKALN